jgi:hypothetical protein
VAAQLAAAVSALFVPLTPSGEADAETSPNAAGTPCGGRDRDGSPPPLRLAQEGTPGLGLYLGTPRGGGGEVPGGMRALPRTPNGSLLPAMQATPRSDGALRHSPPSPALPRTHSAEARALFEEPLPRRRTAPPPGGHS